MKRLSLLIAFSVLFCSYSDAIAGVLYARQPGTEAPLYNLVISKIRTTVNIVGQLAVTHVDEEFFNDNNITLEGFYAFQLPEGARVSGLWLWENNKRLRFIVLKKEDAQRMYDSVVVGVRRDPAILESLGANRFQLKVFPIPPQSSRRIEIRYFYTLPLTPDGYVNYFYPLNMLGYQSTPVELTELKINISSKQKILDFNTSFNGNPLLNRVTKLDDYRYTIDFGLEQQNYTRDYTLRYKPENIFSIFPALSWHDPDTTGTDPYFIAWHPVVEDTLSKAPLDAVFVLDASGSMVGTRIETVIKAMKNILWKLNTNDHFRIVLFSSSTMSYPSDGSLLAATSENITSSIEFINRYYVASGGTNYEAAFIDGLKTDFRTLSEKRMVFLTDGEPTTGKTALKDLLNVIGSNNIAGVRIYPIIFYSPSIQLLYDIAVANGGKVSTVDAGDDLEVVISRLLLDMEVKGILNANVTYNDGKTYHVHPQAFPVVISTEQLVTTGRYFGDGKENATLSYRTASGDDRSLTRDIDFETTLTNLKEVGAYWAGKRIDALLDEIKKNGELPELKNSVINLSIKHQVLSPYTAFLVLETNIIDPPISSVDAAHVQPDLFTLNAGYPNPYMISNGGAATISFDIGIASPVRIAIIDALGRVVRILVDDFKTPGRYTISWDGRDDSGSTIPAGVYFVSLIAGKYSATMKLIVGK